MPASRELYEIPQLWHKIPSLYSFLRLTIGTGHEFALTVQVMALIAVIAATCFLWFKTTQFRPKAALLISGVLLMPPYVLYYDYALLAVAIAFVVADGMERGWLRGDRWILSLVAIVPLGGSLLANSTGIQLGWFVVAALFVVAARRAWFRPETKSLAAGGRSCSPVLGQP